MKLEIINPKLYTGLDDILLSSQNHSIFYSSSWASVLNESYQYKPLYFMLIDKGQLQIFLPLMEVSSFLTGKKAVSLPFTDYCAPVVTDDLQVDDVFKFLVDYGKQACWKYIEIRGINGAFHNSPLSSYYYGHTLDLSQNAEQLFAKFRSNTKRNIKKAMKENVEVIIDNSLASMKEFYTLNCMTRKMHGLPPQPYLFFKKVFEHLISRNQGLLALALYHGKVIAGSVFFNFGKRAIYKYGASDYKYQHLRHNNLVMWEAIKWYSQNGYKSLCFGRTEPENIGLRNFKLGWGTKERIIKYYRYDLRKNEFVTGNNNISGFHNKVFRVLPTQLSRLIGKALYRHVG